MIITAENIMRKITFFHERFYKDDRHLREHLKRHFFNFFILICEHMNKTIICMEKTLVAKICHLS